MVLPDVPDAAARRKARGAFFTPPALAVYVTRWAVRDPADRVLEPSCGEAAFVLAAGARLAELGAPAAAMRLDGSELHATSVRVARQQLADQGFNASIVAEDFFRRPPDPIYDAVIGNPPYVRYQAFTGEHRATARAAALRGGVQLTNLASSWAAFTVHAALFVRPGGRLGLVLPAELLSVNYAAPVRDFLMRAFARVRLVLFTERVFPGVLEDVVLLLADGRDQGPTGHCELVQARNADDLAQPEGLDVTRWEPGGADRWSGMHLDAAADQTYGRVLRDGSFTPLSAWGETKLGMVTGRNSYFAVSGDAATRLGLSGADLLRISPPGSRHLRGLALSLQRLEELDDSGRRTWLFRPDGEPSAAARRYIRRGERDGVDTAYKCRVRRPWWRVPYLRPADLLLTYMNADTARLCANDAGVHHLNSVHGVYLRTAFRTAGRRLLPLAALNSVTLLGAEVVGRAYGGGILKLEPKEADRWPMPSPELVLARAAPLEELRKPAIRMLAEGRLADAVAAVDEVLFGDGPDVHGLAAVRDARARLHGRRAARGRSRPT